MPRTVIEETKEKKVPFKKCAEPGCNNKAEFNDPINKRSYCRLCKINYFCSKETIKIIDSDEIDESINFISRVLEAMSNHAKLYNADFVYNEFSNTLRDYKTKLLHIVNRFKEATTSNSIEQYAFINNKALELKKELDNSELMHNFVNHRFQVTLGQCIKDPSQFSSLNEIDFNDQLIKLKAQIEKDYKKKSDKKLDKEIKFIKQNLKRKYESQLEDLTNKVNQQEAIIEEKNEEEKDYISQIILLEKEKKFDEIKILSLNEKVQHAIKCFLELYHTKTGVARPDKIENTDFNLSLNTPAHIEVLLYTKLFKLPDIKRIYLQYIPENNSELLQFLENSSPDRLRILTFGWSSTARVKIDFYLNGLKKALKGVSKEVLTNYWIYSKDSLEKVVRASANCERLIIRHSVTDCDQDLDFSGPVYKVKYFGFPYCGDYSGNAWSTNPDKLRRIIKAISESSMKESLTTLNIFQCGVSIQNAKSLLNAYGMPIVNVVAEENQPSND